MIHPGEQWVDLPILNVYNTQMMMAAVNVARDMYEKGLQQIKDFKNEYGDFFSPIQKDMDWHSQNVTGKVRNAINYLYDNGIDPIKSAEGRAAVSRIINSIDTARIARNRLSAIAANEFIKNRGILEAKGLYNEAFDNAVNGTKLEDWDSANGVWNRVSPTEYRTIKELTQDWFNSRTPYELTEELVEGMGYKYDPRYKYEGFTFNDLMDVAATNTPGWLNSVYANYYRDLARKLLVASGNTNPSASEVEEQLQRNVANANMEFLVKPSTKADEYQKMAVQHSYDVAMENLRDRYRKEAEQRKEDAQQANSYNFADRLYQDAVGNIFGVGYALYNPLAMGQSIYRTQYDYILTLPGAKWQNASNTGNITQSGIDQLLNRYSMSKGITFNQFLYNVEGNKVKDDNAVYMTEQDIPHLVSDAGLATYTAGYRGNVVNSDRYREELKGAGYKNLVMKPTGRVYGAQMRDGRFKTYAQVIIKRNDDGPIAEVSRGKLRGSNDVNQRIMWLDLGIESNKSANYVYDPQDLTPSYSSEHYRQTRSREVNQQTWHQKATDDDTDIVPRIAWPQ